MAAIVSNDFTTLYMYVRSIVIIDINGKKMARNKIYERILCSTIFLLNVIFSSEKCYVLFLNVVVIAVVVNPLAISDAFILGRATCYSLDSVHEWFKVVVRIEIQVYEFVRQSPISLVRFIVEGSQSIALPDVRQDVLRPLNHRRIDARCAGDVMGVTGSAQSVLEFVQVHNLFSVGDIVERLVFQMRDVADQS